MEEQKESHKQEIRHKRKKELNTPLYQRIFAVIGIVLVVLALYNVLQASSFNKLFEKRLNEAKEAAKPAKLQLITITDSNCADCFDITSIIDSIKRANINITQEESLDLRDDNAKKLIDEYDIEKVPTVLLFGEINKTRITGLEKNGDALILAQLDPPYTDAKSNKISGRVSAVIIKDSSCSKCTDLSPTLDEVRKLGVKATEYTVDKASNKGKELIQKYSIKMLPTLILSKDLEVYGSEITSQFKQIASVEPDGSYVTRTVNPPYINLSTNKVIGLVSMIVLVDNTCNECYDAEKIHKSIMQRMGIALEEERKVDVASSEGKSLREKYNVEKVPTIVLRGDIGTYPLLVTAWKDVGTVDSDGTYVFRKVEFAGQPYKDLTKGEVIKPQVAQAQG